MTVRRTLLLLAAALLAGLVLTVACTQETQNKIGRSIVNWTGTDGVVDVYSGGKLVMRFIKVDKFSTAEASQGNEGARNYRYGFGVLDANQNFKADPGEEKTYFEVANFSTYIFYENPAD